MLVAQAFGFTGLFLKTAGDCVFDFGFDGDSLDGPAPNDALGTGLESVTHARLEPTQHYFAAAQNVNMIGNRAPQTRV